MDALEEAKIKSEIANLNRQTTLFGVQIWTAGFLAGAAVIGAPVAITTALLTWIGS